MNWYKKSQEKPNEEESFVENVSKYISKGEFEDAIRRIYYQNREIFEEEGWKTWKEWVDNNDADELAVNLDSYHELYSLYFNRFPEGINVYDASRAYKAGKLQDLPRQTYKYERVPLKEDSQEFSPEHPWQSKKLYLTQKELKQILENAKTRITKSNSKNVLEARKTIFLTYNSDKDLAERLSIPESELNKLLYSWSNFSVKSKDFQFQLNRDVPEEHQWSGIKNASFLNMVGVNHAEIDSYVKSIQINKDEVRSYYGDGGESLRKYLMSVFLCLDTKLSYNDLDFIIKKIPESGGRRPLGQYDQAKNSITIESINRRTVAHEIGHYLDYKFCREINPKSVISLSEDDSIHPDNAEYMSRGVPKERLAWAKKYNEFVKNLMSKGEISSEYHQRAGETFARFVAQFVKWTSKMAGNRIFDEEYSGDKFTQEDFTTFVYLLQEKSYLDKHFPNK